MKVQEIALRQEIRQMMNEAGINKNTLKEMVKSVLDEEVKRACRQAFNEKDTESISKQFINSNIREIIREQTKRVIQDQIHNRFSGMRIRVDITDESGTSSASS